MGQSVFVLILMLISNGSDAVGTQISIVTSGDADFLAETLAFLQATGRQKIGDQSVHTSSQRRFRFDKSRIKADRRDTSSRVERTIFLESDVQQTNSRAKFKGRGWCCRAAERVSATKSFKTGKLRRSKAPSIRSR